VLVSAAAKLAPTSRVYPLRFYSARTFIDATKSCSSENSKITIASVFQDAGDDMRQSITTAKRLSCMPQKKKGSVGAKCVDAALDVLPRVGRSRLFLEPAEQPVDDGFAVLFVDGFG
jgi:hypothetical protein